MDGVCSVVMAIAQLESYGLNVVGRVMIETHEATLNPLVFLKQIIQFGDTPFSRDKSPLYAHIKDGLGILEKS